MSHSRTAAPKAKKLVIELVIGSSLEDAFDVVDSLLDSGALQGAIAEMGLDTDRPVKIKYASVRYG